MSEQANSSRTGHPCKIVAVGRTSPDRSHLEPELSCVGGLILDNRAWPDVSAIVRESDFHEEKNRIIFGAIRDLATAGKPFDPVTLLDELERTGQLADAGGATWLGQAGRDTPSAANVTHYAQIVRRKSLERQRTAAIERGDHHQAADLTAAIDALEAGTSASTLLADYVPVSSLDGQSFSRTYLVEGLIEQGRVYEFFGKYKEGKTLAVIDMVANLSVAQTWADRRTAQALVVWVAGEAVDDVQMRIAAWRLRHGVTDPMPFYIRTKPVYMTDQQFAHRLVQEIEALKTQHPGLPALLVLDTVARCMAPGADENSITGLGAFANNLLDIVVRPLNATAICVHHSGHGDSDRGRGHSSFEGAVDGVIKVSMDRSSGQPVITVAASRIRSTAGDDSLSFRIEVQELPGQDNFGNPIDAPVLHHLEGYQLAQRRLTEHEKTALSVLEQQGDMLIGDWRKAFYNEVRKTKPDALAPTLKKTFRRTVDMLKARCLISEQDNIYSLCSPSTGGQKGHVPHLSPLSPDIGIGGQGDKGDTHLKVCPPVPLPVPVHSTEMRQESCLRCEGSGRLVIDGQAGYCMHCAGRGYVDLLPGREQTVDGDYLGMTYREAGAKGTPRGNPDQQPAVDDDAKGTKGTCTPCTPNVPHSSAPPDPAADPGYWAGMEPTGPAADDDDGFVDVDDLV